MIQTILGIAKKASCEIFEEYLKGTTEGFSKQIAKGILKASAEPRSHSQRNRRRN